VFGRLALAGPSIAKVKRIPYTSSGEQVTVVVDFGSRMLYDWHLPL
jgi:hypothetical protein